MKILTHMSICIASVFLLSAYAQTSVAKMNCAKKIANIYSGKSCEDKFKSCMSKTGLSSYCNAEDAGSLQNLCRGQLHVEEKSKCPNNTGTCRIGYGDDKDAANDAYSGKRIVEHSSYYIHKDGQTAVQIWGGFGSGKTCY